MSKDTIFLENTQKFLKSGFREDISEIKIKIFQWGFMDVQDWYYPKVCKQEWILYWNLIPGLRININGKSYYPDIDKVYLFPPYTRFGGRIEKDFRQFYMHFRAESPFDAVEPEPVIFSSDEIKENMLKVVSSGKTLQQSLYLTAIAITALEHVPEKMFMSGSSSISDNRIYKVIDLINQNPGREHRIEDLCEMVNMSLNHFHREFKKALFTTPKQYVLMKRMELSRDLIMDNNLSIDEVAERSGFSNRYHFSKAFKNYYLYPPVIYRKKMSEKKSKKRAKKKEVAYDKN